MNREEKAARLNKFANGIIIGEKVYFSGQVFIVRYMGKEMEAAFICVDKEKLWVYIQLMDWKYNHRLTLKSFQELNNILIGVTDKVNPHVHCPKCVIPKDSEIPGLPLAWAWYIFLMAISTIFKDAIGLWILYSVVFFGYRHGKRKTAGVGYIWD